MNTCKLKIMFTYPVLYSFCLLEDQQGICDFTVRKKFLNPLESDPESLSTVTWMELRVFCSSEGTAKSVERRLYVQPESSQSRVPQHLDKKSCRGWWGGRAQPPPSSPRAAVSGDEECLGPSRKVQPAGQVLDQWGTSPGIGFPAL